MSALPILAVLTFGFTLSHFQRTSLSAIAPDLMIELNLSPDAFGLIASGVFLGVAAGQLPTGILLDRFGTRRVTPVVLLLSVIGSLWFAAADSVWALFASRFLIGLGIASTLMGTLVVAARWFPPDRFATVSSVVFAVAGGVGNGVGTAPMAAAADVVGWRWAFVGVAGVMALASALVALVARDAPPGHPFWKRSPETLRASLAGVVEVAKLPGMWRILIMAMMGYPALMTVLGGWGGPYLADVYGLGSVARGNVLAAMVAGNVLGFVVIGPLDRWLDTRKGVVMGGASLCVVVLGTLALWPHPPLAVVVALLVLFGFATAFSVTNIALGRAIVPERLMGRGVTMVNMATFVGNAATQLVAGPIIGLFVTGGPAPEAAYRVVYGSLAVVFVVALMLYRSVADRRPSDERAGRPLKH
ncbi:MAG TPA: MFS transporter [Alphaproteobacteria bacterium]|jgi:MFS family permease|nr:MFS transporter [Alphaproteobacteria bacterium]